MSELIKINDQDKRIIVIGLEAELKRIDRATKPTDLETAVAHYRAQLIKTLKRLEPQKHRWTS